MKTKNRIYDDSSASYTVRNSTRGGIEYFSGDDWVVIRTYLFMFPEFQNDQSLQRGVYSCVHCWAAGWYSTEEERKFQIKILDFSRNWDVGISTRVTRSRILESYSHTVHNISENAKTKNLVSIFVSRLMSHFIAISRQHEFIRHCVEQPQ